MASLTLENVYKQYPNGFETVKDLSFHVDDGEFAILTGPSGGGKSAIMHMIAGMEEVNSGTIRIGDRVVNHLDPVERGIAMIFQNYALYSRMTVVENVELGLRLRGESEREIIERSAEALKLLGITTIRSERVKNLSDLQKHRTALARAMILKPTILLMDEPLRNVSSKYHKQLCKELVELQKKTGVTILYSTRNPEEIETLGKRQIIVK